MDAISFLKKQHTKIRESFSEIQKKSHHRDTQKKMFSELSDFLINHETMEQQIWYPFLETLAIEKINKLIKHLTAEEKKAHESIDKIKEINSKDAWSVWESKITKLNQDVDQHANEEESKLFPEVLNQLPKEKLELIGLEMHRFFQSERWLK